MGRPLHRGSGLNWLTVPWRNGRSVALFNWRAWLEINIFSVVGYAFGQVASSQRAWIVILTSLSEIAFLRVASSQRAWIEIRSLVPCFTFAWSPSSQRAWIELFAIKFQNFHVVALFTEGVD